MAEGAVVIPAEISETDLRVEAVADAHAAVEIAQAEAAVAAAEVAVAECEAAAERAGETVLFDEEDKRWLEERLQSHKSETENLLKTETALLREQISALKLAMETLALSLSSPSAVSIPAPMMPETVVVAEPETAKSESENSTASAGRESRRMRRRI